MARIRHSSARARRNRSPRAESGQVLIMFVLLLPVLLGMVAMSVDIGSYASERSTL